MGRPHRIDTTGAWHHLMNRGADRQDIFSSDDDRFVFEDQLGELARRGLLEIHAYTLMGNHFHVLGRSPEGELSRAMHRLGSEYARWYNHEHHRDGPLFRNRFVSVAVGSTEQLLTESRYIHRNPLAFVPTASLAAYRWSSLGPYLRRRERPDWLRLDLIDGLIGDPDQHRTFVEASHPSDKDHSRWQTMRPPVDLADIERAIQEVTGTDPACSVADGPRSNDRLSIAIVLAVELRAATAEQLARRYGASSPASTRAAARRGRVRLGADPAFARLRDRAMSQLFAA